MAVTSVGSTLSSIVKERGMAALQAHSSNNNYWSAANAAHTGTDPLANLLYGLPPSETGDISKPTEASVKDKECVTHQVARLGAKPLPCECTYLVSLSAKYVPVFVMMKIDTILH